MVMLQHNHNLASQHHHNHLSHHQHLQALHQRLAQSPTMSNGSTTTAAAPESNGGGSDSAADRSPSSPVSQRKAAASSVEADLETLDRELCALDAAMPLVDPEITQGAEQLEQAMVSRKRKFASIDDDDSDRLVREALSQIYFPSAGRLLTGIDDCPPATEQRREEDEQQQRTNAGDAAAAADCISPKRPKIGDLLEHHQSQQQQQQLHSFSHPFLHPFHPLPDLAGFDYQVHHHHQKEFEVIMDALRLGVSNGGAMAAAAVVAATSAAGAAAAAAAAAA
uniref:Uncharacterized protein n=1 Tax=Anopheles melas TaxID=34690 RepID=A0A182UDS4_9DIPT